MITAIEEMNEKCKELRNSKKQTQEFEILDLIELLYGTCCVTSIVMINQML